MKNLNSKLTPLEMKRGPLPSLQAGDIILIHTRQSLLRGLIRRVIGSYWDHSALVAYPQGEHGLTHNIIIENIKPKHELVYFFFYRARKGTEIHRLNKYLSDPKKYDVGIKRVPGLSARHQERLRSFIISNIDTPYWRLPLIKFFLAWLSPQYRRWFLLQQRWSCSALVQHAFYESGDSWEDRLKVVFKEGDQSPIEAQDLTSPADIASSPKAEWIFNQQ